MVDDLEVLRCSASSSEFTDDTNHAKLPSLALDDLKAEDMRRGRSAKATRRRRCTPKWGFAEGRGWEFGLGSLPPFLLLRGLEPRTATSARGGGISVSGGFYIVGTIPVLLPRAFLRAGARHPAVYKVVQRSKTARQEAGFLPHARNGCQRMRWVDVSHQGTQHSRQYNVSADTGAFEICRSRPRAPDVSTLQSVEDDQLGSTCTHSPYHACPCAHFLGGGVLVPALPSPSPPVHAP